MKLFKIAFLTLIAASMSFCVACTCSQDKKEENTQSTTNTPKTEPSTNEPTSKDIGKNGGKIEEQNVSINIPAGALKADTKIVAQYVEEETVITSTPMTGFLGGVEFGPSGTKFDSPVEVNLKINQQPKNSELSVYCYDETNDIWDFVTKANYSNGTASFNITHFSKYAVLDITPSMYMKFVELVRTAQSTGKSDTWISESYKEYLIDEQRVLDYYQEFDGYYYEPCGIRIFGKYQINGKEGNQEALSTLIGETNKKGNTYGISQVGGLTVGKAEADKASSNEEVIDVTVTIDYKIINPQLSLSASKTKIEEGDSATIDVLCHYAKPGNVLFPDIVLGGYPLTVSQPTHFTSNKVLITSDDSGHASFVVTSLDGKKDTISVVFNDADAYGQGSIKLNDNDDYSISNHVVEEVSFTYYQNYVPSSEYTITQLEQGSFILKLEYDLNGDFTIDQDNVVSGEITCENVTATLSTARTVMQVYLNLGGGEYERTVSSYHFFQTYNITATGNMSFPISGQYNKQDDKVNINFGAGSTNTILEIKGKFNGWAEGSGFVDIAREDYYYDCSAKMVLNGDSHVYNNLTLSGDEIKLTSVELIDTFSINFDYDFVNDPQNLNPTFPNYGPDVWTTKTTQTIVIS